MASKRFEQRKRLNLKKGRKRKVPVNRVPMIGKHAVRMQMHALALQIWNQNQTKIFANNYRSNALFYILCGIVSIEWHKCNNNLAFECNGMKTLNVFLSEIMHIIVFFFALCDVPHLLKSLSFFSLLHLCSEASHRKRSCTLWAKRNSLSRTFIFMYRLRIRVIGFLCCEAISRALNTIKEQIFPLWLLLEIRMWALPIFFTTSTLSNHPKYWFSIKLPNIIKKVPNATHPNTNSILNHTKLTICHLHNVF